ncbi:MAG: M23 family metallopeptidase [Spirochaetaceae bacterium]|nr:M23 family metallopeptidase [Spirochaetaceae bacterium]
MLGGLRALLSRTSVRILLSLIAVYTVTGLGFYPASVNSAGVVIKDGEPPAPESGVGMAYAAPAAAEEDVISPEGEPLMAGLREPPEYSRPQMLLYSAYTVKPGDTIGELAMNFGLNQDTLLSLNSIRNSRALQIGQVLRIPNQDGILYTVKTADSLGSIAEKYGTEVAAIQTVNELFSGSVKAGSGLFIPGARLPQADLQEINGDLFIWPIRGYITSPYGYRLHPYTKVRHFHSGIDIGASQGTPIKAAMAGRVTAATYNETNGFYVVITHHSGYRTLYAHLSVIRTKAGDYVKTAEIIGDVGSTGVSTGPHLHFTVYKNGVTVNPRSLVN